MNKWPAGIPPIEPDFTAPEIVTLQGVRILLVEDSWHVAHALEAILENIGMVVEGPAATIREAEQIIQTRQLDVAVIDMNLRGEMADGVIGTLRDKDVPVIIVSGYEVLPSVQQSAAAVLTKPIRAEHLLTHLRRVVASSKATADSEIVAES